MPEFPIVLLALYMYTDGCHEASIDVPSLKVSVVICCHTMERIDDLRLSIKAAIGQTFASCEVVVAVDHNQELLDALQAGLPSSMKVVPNTGVKGLSDTRNAGIAASSGNVIVFFDDDAVAEPDCVNMLVQQYRVRSVAGVGGRSVPAWESGRPSWFPEELDWIVGSTYKGAPEVVSQVNRLIGCNMSFRREVFDTVGMFSTELGRVGTAGEGEDSEICMRVRHQMPGTVLLYEPRAVVHHKVPHHRSTFRYLLSRSYSGGVSVASISRMYADSEASPESTATERGYLSYILTAAVPSRFKRLYRPASIAQLVAIGASVLATGLGFLVGMVRGSAGSPDANPEC